MVLFLLHLYPRFYNSTVEKGYVPISFVSKVI